MCVCSRAWCFCMILQFDSTRISFGISLWIVELNIFGNCVFGENVANALRLNKYLRIASADRMQSTSTAECVHNRDDGRCVPHSRRIRIVNANSFRSTYPFIHLIFKFVCNFHFDNNNYTKHEHVDTHTAHHLWVPLWVLVPSGGFDSNMCASIRYTSKDYFAYVLVVLTTSSIRFSVANWHESIHS